MAIMSPSNDANYYSSAPGFRRPSPQPLAAGGGGGGAAQLGMGGGSAMGQPGRNPFSALFDPSRGGLTGLIGRAMGNPTREEYHAEQAGLARSAGLQKLAHALSEGVPPQKAILEFVNTEEGMEFMMKDPDPMGTIENFIKMSSPAENDVNVGGVIARRGADGSYSTVFQPPEQATEKVRTFTDMAELAGLTAEETSELARGQLMQDQAGDPTETEAATARLVEAGLMSPTMRDQILSGQIKVMPRTNKFGETSGFSVVDTLTGTVTDLENVEKEPVIGDEDFAPGVSKGTTEADIKGAPAGKFLSELEDPADVVRGAGMLGVLGEAAGGLFGQQFPELAARELQSQRNGLRQILADAQNMRDLMSQNSHSSAAETKRIESMVNNLGILTGPLNAAQSLIDWHDFINRHEETAQATLDDEGTTDEARGNAAAMLQAIERARANLPSVEDLQRKITELEAEPGMLTKGVTSAIETGKGILRKEGVLGPETPAAPEKQNTAKTYASEKEAYDAFKRGDFGYDEPVIINGKAFKLPKPKGE